MRHVRSETPCYIVWVEARPTSNGKGKEVYYETVKRAARSVIQTPIATPDVEVEIVYSTVINPAERMDTGNIQKPTLDALIGVAYNDDRQVRDVDCTLFDRSTATNVKGRVEHMGRLFYTPHPHVVLIVIYSDSRLTEMGGASIVQQRRYEEFDRNFNAALRDATLNAAKESQDEFIPTAGVYREPSTGYFVCPRCRGNNKRSLLVEGKEGYHCPVCTGFFGDSAKRKARSAAPYRPTSAWG